MNSPLRLLCRYSSTKPHTAWTFTLVLPTSLLWCTIPRPWNECTSLPLPLRLMASSSRTGAAQTVTSLLQRNQEVYTRFSPQSKKNDSGKTSRRSWLTGSASHQAGQAPGIWCLVPLQPGWMSYYPEPKDDGSPHCIGHQRPQVWPLLWGGRQRPQDGIKYKEFQSHQDQQ